jgi:molybdopterin-guanine dinucleotide biosynthesis protein
MSLVVIGGHSRSVGKTSVVAGLISAIPERNWTAIKITQYGHGICSKNGEPCDCAVTDQEHSFAFTEERDRSGESDTSRFLVAGARRSLWVRTRQGYLAEAMPDLRRRLALADDVIIESNSVMKFLRPDIYLTVLNPANPDFKESAREFLDFADGVILDQPGPDALQMAPVWENVSLKPVAGKPIFKVNPPQYVTSEIVEFVRKRLGMTNF